MWSHRTLAIICVTPCALSGTLIGASATHAAVDNHISLVSVATPEVFPGANGSITRAISDDGRFVVFASSQPNVVVGDEADPNGRYLYLRDLQSGTTTRLTHGTAGTLTGNAAISGDGGYIAFANVDDDGLSNLRLYNRVTGVTTVISKPPATPEEWFTVAISDNGRYVVYTRTATAAGDTFETKLFRYDVQTGLTDRPITGKLGGTIDNPNYATIPSLSSDGRYATFVQATAPAQVVTPFRLVRLDVTTGTKVIIGKSAPHAIPQNAFGDPTISNDGRYVAYTPLDNAGKVSTYVYDASTATSQLVSRSTSGTKANASAGVAQISGNGRYVTFVSAATDIVPGLPAVSTIYVHDRQSGTAEAIVKNRQGVYPGSTGANSSLPYIDGDGSTVAFTSKAQNLTVGADNRLERVYAWQRS